MYDVIVVGARCAGAPAAMLLARKGYDVLLVDRATFPKELPHGHFIHRQGPRLLQRWGLLDRIVATNCPPVTAMTLDLGDFPLTGNDLVEDGIAFGYGPRRGVLDHVLVAAAVEAGAELRQGFVVEEFTGDGDRITGIRGREGGGGSVVAERARVTVGADGRHSRLARAVRAPEYEAAPTLLCYHFSYWSAVPHDHLGVYRTPNSMIFAFPTNDRLFAIFVGWPAAEMAAVRADLEAQFMAALDHVPTLAERVRSGRREERFYGAADLPNFFRKPHGPGWALVGDAGCHKDPFLALGICDAFRDAELLAEALDAGLSGRCPTEAAMAEYERRRNDAAMADYQENMQMARFTPLPAEVYQLRAALRGNPEATTQFFKAREGMIPAETFFNPENLQRVLAAGGVRPAGTAIQDR